jgi:hypothetical protein
MSPADRATLPDMPIENVEDGAAPPWRCQDCVKKDKYAVQRVVDVMRSESGQMFLLMDQAVTTGEVSVSDQSHLCGKTGAVSGRG